MTSLAVGNRRLLKLADILDAVPSTEYDQGHVVSECGSPGCALGYWASNHGPKKNWVLTQWGITYVPTGTQGTSVGAEIFGMSSREAYDMFNSTGCDNAKTGKQAAKYIRAFVAKRSAK